MISGTNSFRKEYIEKSLYIASFYIMNAAETCIYEVEAIKVEIHMYSA